MLHQDEVLLFNTVEEFQERPNYEPALAATAEELDRIVGKYQLPRPKQAWIACGLNGCTEPHRYGYVVRMIDGRETQCGSTCGAKNFGVKWEELEARVKAQEDAKALANVIEELLQERQARLAVAIALVDPSALLEARISEARGWLRSSTALWRRIEECAKLDGSIRVQVEPPPGGQTFGGSRNTAMKTVAVLEGARLLPTEVTFYSNVLRKHVVPALQQLEFAIKSAPDNATLKAISKDASKLNATILMAQKQLSLGSKLFAPGNLQKIEHIVSGQLAARYVDFDLRKSLIGLYRMADVVP